MDFPEPLLPATLTRRYKRFLADVTLADGEEITVHCPNSGSMLGCSEPGSDVMISLSPNPKRKYPHTLEMVKTGNTWVGINTSRTNHLVREALENNLFPEMGPFTSIKPEVRVGKSRLDFMLTGNGGETYIEVKNCTLVRNRCAMFPDAVTARGTKHLHELMTLTGLGHHSAMIVCVQRKDAEYFSPAADIDPLYSTTLTEAANSGVTVLACRARVTPASITVTRQLPVVL